MKQIAINDTAYETRIAIIEDGNLAELLSERESERGIVGNVYRGRVVNVLPGMQAAFVDIGLSKNGFLYIDDCLPPSENRGQGKPNIRELFHEGEEVFVQVSKEAFGTKGPRLTTQLSLPGRYLVYMPMVNHIGISRRIEDEEERKRLRKLAESLREDGDGLIIRTVAHGVRDEELREDYSELATLWVDALKESKDRGTPTLVYRDLGFIPRILRDYLDHEVKEIIVDRSVTYRNVLKFISSIAPHFKERVTYYQGRENLFSYLELDGEIEKSLRRKVWLKSGGYLVIDQTEALTIIDVNTGKFTGKYDSNQTILKTNLEAAHESLKQIRLRNIAGIILIDFIDMHNEEDQTMILEAMQHGIRKDRNKMQIFGITRLGLLEMTRKKVKQSLRDTVTSPCPCCDGTGRVKSPETILLQMERMLMEHRHVDIEAVLVELFKEVAQELQGIDQNRLRILEKEVGFKIFIAACEDVHPEHLKIAFMGKEVEVRRRLPLTNT